MLKILKPMFLKYFYFNRHLNSLIFNIEKVELTGNSIFEYIHQADHDEMISVLSPPLPQNLPAENMMMSK